MVEHEYICLGCGGHYRLQVEQESDIKDKVCPNCGISNFVKKNPADLFNELFGHIGGG